MLFLLLPCYCLVSAKAGIDDCQSLTELRSETERYFSSNRPLMADLNEDGSVTLRVIQRVAELTGITDQGWNLDFVTTLRNNWNLSRVNATCSILYQGNSPDLGIINIIKIRDLINLITDRYAIPYTQERNLFSSAIDIAQRIGVYDPQSPQGPWNTWIGMVLPDELPAMEVIYKIIHEQVHHLEFSELSSSWLSAIVTLLQNSNPSSPCPSNVLWPAYALTKQFSSYGTAEGLDHVWPADAITRYYKSSFSQSDLDATSLRSSGEDSLSTEKAHTCLSAVKHLCKGLDALYPYKIESPNENQINLIFSFSHLRKICLYFQYAENSGAVRVPNFNFPQYHQQIVKYSWKEESELSAANTEEKGYDKLKESMLKSLKDLSPYFRGWFEMLFASCQEVYFLPILQDNRFYSARFHFRGSEAVLGFSFFSTDRS
jgi:hypothetical protein